MNTAGWLTWEVRSKALPAKTEPLLAAPFLGSVPAQSPIARKRWDKNWGISGTPTASAAGAGAPWLLMPRSAHHRTTRDFIARIARTLARRFFGGLALGQVVSRTTLPSELILTVGAGASRQAAPLTHSPLWISNL